jgi:hypothetical protein
MQNAATATVVNIIVLPRTTRRVVYTDTARITNHTVGYAVCIAGSAIYQR